MYDIVQMSGIDPRIERSRELLSAAAVQILQTGGWESLSVARLCSEAGVSRSTFYLQFQQAWEPIAAHIEQCFSSEHPELLDDTVTLNPETLLLKGHPLSYSFFAHLERHELLYQKIFETPHSAPLRHAITTRVAEISRMHHSVLRTLRESGDTQKHEPLDAEYVAAYLSGALVELAGRWIVRSPRDSAAAMAYWFSQMAAPGLLQMMGLTSLLEE